MRPALLTLATLLALQAQSPSFEVASIKPNRSAAVDSNMNSLPHGRLIATNITVMELIRFAYTMKDYQISHAPRWLDSDRFDINAKTAESKRTVLDDLKSQIRQLLEERFQLAIHRETKPMPVYLLTVAKGGPKLKRHDEGKGSGTRNRCGHLTGTRLTMDTIATALSRHFERDVLNRTQLEGKYDFELDWTPDTGPCPDAEPRPSIFTAIQEQLGLRLEPSKGPVGILIIDHIAHPSEN